MSGARGGKTSGFETSADVCVVGSGAAGAVIADELVASGLSVLVLEEGPRIRPQQYAAMRPTEAFRTMARSAGLMSTISVDGSPTVALFAGRTVGGSSVLTGGVCFRPSDDVLAGWQSDGLTELTPSALEACYERVERRLNVGPVPETLRSDGTQLFVRGAALRGGTMAPVPRNTRGCRGAGRCNFGCPHGAKLSVDVSYLASAERLGAEVRANCRVDRILVRGRRAVGVAGRVLDGRPAKPVGAFTVHARAVVVAAGALSTPTLLRASGLGRGSVGLGKGLTLHPSVRVIADAGRDLDDDGAAQSVYSNDFAADGIMLVGVNVPRSLRVAVLPGAGAAFREQVARVGSMAGFGALVHDRDSCGEILRGPWRERIVRYRMGPRDRAALVRSVRLLAEIAFAGGARKVFLPVFGVPPITNVDGLRALDRAPLSRFECASFHPLGGARMGPSPRSSVVNPVGRTHEVENLFVADGSILPSPPGVHPQLSIMAIATWIAWRLRDAWKGIRAMPS